MVLKISDRQLVKQCLAGEQAAFAEIVTRYKGLIYHVIYSFFLNRLETDDICQEVFIKIYQSLPSYNAEYQLSSWMSRIAANHCLDVLRKKKAPTVSLEEYAPVMEAGNTPEEQFLERELIDQVRQLLGSLPEKYRLVLSLFHQAGLSYQEIAATLRLPVTVVKNRLYRARLMLQERFAALEKEVY